MVQKINNKKTQPPIKKNKNQFLGSFMRKISQPALRTPHFNCDGDNKYQSKVMIIVFATLSLCFMFIVLYYTIPTFVDKPIRS